MTTIEVGGLEITHTGPAPYQARSASDRNPDWPIWFVADATGFNGIKVKGSLAKLFEPEAARRIADALNAASG